MSDLLVLHVERVLREMVAGRVVPFFGAGVNLCDRPEQMDWSVEQTDFLPSGGELSSYLADYFGYPTNDKHELAKVSEYVDLVSGSGPLYDELHHLFDRDYSPTLLHRFFAHLPSILSTKGYSPHYQLIVTTNYDDLMERALIDAGVDHDVVSYIADGKEAGKFVHHDPEGVETIVHKPNEYTGIALDEFGNLQRPVVLKLHGEVKRQQYDADADSYVITEDHYINYLTHTDISSLLPVNIVRKLKRSHFLFLGYGLRDWNMRVILHQIWGNQKLKYHSWAIQHQPQELDQKFWGKKDVKIFDVDLKQYIEQLEQQLSSMKMKRGEE